MTFDHRRTRSVVTVVDASGAPVAHQDVVVRQVRHAFEFGCTGFDVPEWTPQLHDMWLGVFDTATLPVYWEVRARRGETERERLTESARWFHARDVRLRGIRWSGTPSRRPGWTRSPARRRGAAPRPDPARGRRLRRAHRHVGRDQRGRHHAAVHERAGQCAERDHPPLREQGRVPMVQMAVDEARSGGTRPTLLINDFDLGPEYEHLIEELLEAGVSIDGIGLQSHMHQGFRAPSSCARSPTGSLASGSPALDGDVPGLRESHAGDDRGPQRLRGRRVAVDHGGRGPSGGRHRRALQHAGRAPGGLVDHVLGMEDCGAWLGAPIGLVRRDGSPKPSYDALRALVRGEWWFDPTPMRTDEAGRIVVEGSPAGTTWRRASGMPSSISRQGGRSSGCVSTSSAWAIDGSRRPGRAPPGEGRPRRGASRRASPGVDLIRTRR
ncbi:endo-1,4-beta-xylanase [Oerskovia sp. M15]